MVSRVASQHVVELDVIDLVGSLGLEALEDDGIFLICDHHAEIVKDRSEASEGNESTAALILILEVRFDEETTVLDIGSKALEDSNKDLFFSSVQDILGVKDRGRIKWIDSGRRVLLESFICEDCVELLSEIKVVDAAGVVRHSVVSLKSLVLSRCQGNTLRVEHTAELLCWQIALAENIVILEELLKSDSIFLDHLLHFGHQGLVLLLAVEISESVDVG